MDKLKSIYASASSAVVTIIAVTAVTIATEFSVPFKDFLASFTGHHWVTKSYLSIILFVLFYLLFNSGKKFVTADDTRRAVNILATFAVLGFIVILGFFSYEFFGH